MFWHMNLRSLAVPQVLMHEEMFAVQTTNKHVAAQTRSAAAEYIGVSERYLDKLIRDGHLPKVKLGRKTLIRTCDLEKLLEENLHVPEKDVPHGNLGTGN